MAQLIRALDDMICIDECRSFQLVFGDPHDNEPGKSDGCLRVDSDLVSFASRAGDHCAAIRLEAWDAQPPAAAEPWRKAGETRFAGNSGVWVETRFEPVCSFLIGPPHFEYGLAVYTVGADHEAEKWLLRFWPVRDVFDPLRHALPAPYADIDEDDEPPVWRVEPARVPVPVSAATDWPSLQPPSRPHRPDFHAWLQGRGVTLHQYLRRKRGVDIEDGAEITPELLALAEGRPNRFADPPVDRHYAELNMENRLPEGFEDRPAHDQERWLRDDLADRQRVEGLNPHRESAYLVPVQEGFVAVGASFRAWRWVEERYLPKDHGQEVVARDVLSRQVLITEIVTVLDSEQVPGSSWPRYTVRRAAPVEVARVLCAEATWSDAELDTR